MKLHKITTNPNLFDGAQAGWCGPAAISAITGRSRECASAWINYARERMPHQLVRGTHTHEVRNALIELGYAMRRLYVGPGITLARWLKLRSPAERTHMFLICAGLHWIVVKGNRAACSMKGNTATSKCSKRRAVVQDVWVIRPIADRKHVRAKRVDPLPSWRRWRDRLDGLGYGQGMVTKRIRYNKRPYPKSHEVE